MGIRQSTAFNEENFREGIRGYREMFESLHLEEKELKTLWIEFGKIVQDESETITIRELLDYCDLERTPFAYRLFGIFDEDNSGSVDFREFVTATWNCCTMDRDSLLRFAFDLFDTDRSGMLEASEVESLLREVYGKSLDDNINALHALERFKKLSSKNGDGDSLSRSSEDAFEEGSHAITFEAFREFCRQHARALLPVFTLQRKVRSKIVSERFWKGCFDRRYGSSTTCFGVTKRRSKEDPPLPQIRLEHLSTMMRNPKTEGTEPWTENVTDNKNGATTADSETPEPSPGAMKKVLKGKGGGTGNHPGSGKKRDKTKRLSNSDRLVAAVEADRDKMSGPAKRARIRDSVTSATAQAKPVLSVVNSKLEAKGIGGGMRLNHSLAVEVPGEDKKYAQRKGTAHHKKPQSTLGAGDEGGGRHRRASSLRPLESKVSGSGFVEMEKQRGAHHGRLR